MLIRLIIYFISGGITFGDFMEFLSIISKGTTQEKILWSFEFLDLDKNGFIEKQEMLKVRSIVLRRKMKLSLIVVKVLEAVYEMVLPGNNISHSEIVQQVSHQLSTSPYYSLPPG